ncbi:MAG: hypothetical protein ACRBN8_37530 [Nannocystales bacterium]
MPNVRTRIAIATLLAVGACDKGASEETRGSQTPEEPAAQPAPDDALDAAARDAATEPEPGPEPTPPPEPEPTFGPAALTALTDTQRQTLAIGKEDPPLPVDIHYVQSNEKRHDLFFPYIEDVGGCAIGVGSDQTFTAAAKARSTLLFMMDIDRRIVDLHLMHRVFVLASETPAENWAWWDAKNADEAKALLEEKLPDGGATEATVRRTLRGYHAYRETVYRHLRRVIERERNGAQVTWLSDPESYAHIRALYQTGRVRIMQGNLAGAHSMRTAAAACEALGETMRVVYMSNAEEYFTYTPDFVANVQAQPTDAKSVLLRTIYSKKWEHADLWAYQVHKLSDFKERLSDRKNRKRTAMLRYAKKDGGLERESLSIKGFSRIGYVGDDDAP